MNLQNPCQKPKSVQKNGFFRNKSPESGLLKTGLHIDGAGGGELWCRTQNDENVSKISSIGYE
ncbi:MULTISPECIES: hypothetical protein [Enterobacter]|uniref:hypothetical protein n=1 Tax=Enterobacter TaxID=547 RepID=UPI001269E9AB|nr:hypothetical protein [Enterobacter sp. UCD-UG_FMILLET]